MKTDRRALLSGVIFAAALIIGFSHCFAAGFTPKQGDLYFKEIAGVKFHVYTSSIPMGASASVIIETKNTLILQDTQQNKTQNEELKALITSLGKPLNRIYVSHDHSHHWAGLEMFGGVPVYANEDTMNSIRQKGVDMLKDLRGQFGEAAIPYTKVVVPGRNALSSHYLKRPLLSIFGKRQQVRSSDVEGRGTWPACRLGDRYFMDSANKI